MTTKRFLPAKNAPNGKTQKGNEARKPAVLLVDDRSSDGSLLVKQLKMLGFCCFFARSIEEAKARVSAEVFEVVLSKLRMNGGTAYELRPLLIGRPTSLFYSLAVEQDCWWIPGVLHGTECLGEPALRPDEFFQTLVMAASGFIAGTDSGSSVQAN